MSHSRIVRLFPALILALGTTVALSGCVAYPYGDPAYGGYVAGPVVAPSVVIAPSYGPVYRPYGYHGWRGGGWGGRRW